MTRRAFGPDDLAAALAPLHERLDQLEEAILGIGYRIESREERDDALVVGACRELVRAHVPRTARVVVIAKGDPRLLDLYGREAGNFPQDADGRYPGFPVAHSTAAIAHLEAQRVAGAQFVLIPDTASWWTGFFPAFTEHLVGRYHVVADEPGAGLLVDLRARRAADLWPNALSDVLARLASVVGRELGVLDWTGRGLAERLPHLNVFSAPDGPAVPYCDHSVDVVVLDSAAPLSEARRTATVAVVTVGSTSWPTVVNVELCAADAWSDPEVPVRFVVASDSPDPMWLARLEEALADEPSADVIIGADPADCVGDARIVAVVVDGVLPLPGCCAAARRALSSGDYIGAAVPKLLAADGSLEAAGAMVFNDGSWAGVGAGSFEVVAPWHEFVRETCGAPGLVFVSAAGIEKLAGDSPVTPIGLPLEWAAPLWAAGLPVVYQPDAAAVRVSGKGDATSPASASTADEAWAPVLATRPDRPQVLDDHAWRTLLTLDDIQGGWQ